MPQGLGALILDSRAAIWRRIDGSAFELSLRRLRVEFCQFSDLTVAVLQTRLVPVDQEVLVRAGCQPGLNTYTNGVIFFLESVIGHISQRFNLIYFFVSFRYFRGQDCCTIMPSFAVWPGRIWLTRK